MYQYRRSRSLSTLLAGPSVRRGSRAVTALLNGASLSSLLDPFLLTLLALLAVLPLLCILAPTKSSISRKRLDVVRARSGPLRAGAVFVLVGGLGDGLSPRFSGASGLMGGSGDDLEFSLPLDCEESDPFLSHDVDDAVEVVGRTACRVLRGKSRAEVALGRRAWSEDALRSRAEAASCLRLSGVRGDGSLGGLLREMGCCAMVFCLAMAGSEVVEDPEESLAKTAGSDAANGPLGFP